MRPATLLRARRSIAFGLVIAGALIGVAACESDSRTTPSAGAPLVGASLSPRTPDAIPTAKRQVNPAPASGSPSPSTTASGSPAAGGATGSGRRCTVGDDLVPTCGLLWGAAAGGFSTASREEALKTWEATSGQPATIFHTYHSGNQLFPTSAEIAMAHQPGHPRLLLLNWKVAAGTTWAKVAAGDQDARIDREAAYLKRTFTDPFFLVLHHEPEDSVNSNPS
ncbi:MAG TPA: hypothetical protein VGF84_17485, partial [Micromonosporaceae bacterium]